MNISGRVRGETASYEVVCKNGCGRLENELPTDGRDYKRGAIREYNRIYRIRKENEH